MTYKVRIDMAGRRYGCLMGVAFSHKSRSGHAHWVFECDCGGRVTAAGSNVRKGNTTSCGCAHREISAARLTVHGHRAARHHGPTYRAWQIMNDSCANPRGPGWSRCGATGVKVCAAWRSDFARFVQDMGERPAGAVLGRLSPDDDFRPQTCFWSPARTRSERASKPLLSQGIPSQG